MIAGKAELALAGVAACLVAAAVGFTAGARWTQAKCDNEVLTLENKQLEAEARRQQEHDAAQVRAAEAAAAAAGKLAALNQRNAALEQEVLAYASDQTRVRRQCFDARGSRLWNDIATAAAPETDAVRRGADGAGAGGSADPAGDGGER